MSGSCFRYQIILKRYSARKWKRCGRSTKIDKQSTQKRPPSSTTKRTSQSCFVVPRCSAACKKTRSGSSAAGFNRSRSAIPTASGYILPLGSRHLGLGARVSRPRARRAERGFLSYMEFGVMGEWRRGDLTTGCF